MIALVPMNAEEFAAHVERTVTDFAHDKAASGQWSEEAALALARQGYDALLPHGLATPENFLFTLRETTTQTAVGTLWYAIQARADQRIAYVYDLFIQPWCRRRGHAARAFAALEAQVAGRGLSGIGLHVFGHNEAARALYAKLGYEPTNINLFKKIARQDGL
jgi:ribosomal protein S18 acetylase RimI-like enzyme